MYMSFVEISREKAIELGIWSETEPLGSKTEFVLSIECLQDLSARRILERIPRTPPITMQEVVEWQEANKILNSIDMDEARKRVTFIERDEELYFEDSF